MHVNVVQLVSPGGGTHERIRADRIAEENSSVFDCVTDAPDEELENVLDYLGDAAEVTVKDGTTVISVRKDRALDLFRPAFDQFILLLDSLKRHYIRDFATGANDIGLDMFRLSRNYAFDPFYVVGSAYCGRAVPASEWLRGVISGDTGDTFTVCGVFDAHM